ncbi:MAG: polyphosphate:AMP phosphotransferase [Blautia sp.]|uniref:polyphosphate:AMP phosphotransferase n=1 Tax=Blautia sp. TaxID=1955243 RepID=UPI002E796A22|nr:polyphosphate:AMP phosphotransferase [Blautia sp.]
MLEQIDLTKKMPKEVYQKQMEQMETELAALQRDCKALGIPVILVFEGLDASGKGVQINKLIHPLDPRGFEVHAIKEETEEERMHPFLWRFWTKTPEKGRIAIFDTSWYRKVSIERFEHKLPKEELAYVYQEITTFERALADDGNVLIKFFLHISQKEQRKRFDKMLHSKETAWKVSKEDEKRNKEYHRYKEICEEMLERTESEYAPWILIEAEDRRFATAKIFSQVIRQLKERVYQEKEKLDQKTSSESSDIQMETDQKNLMESSVLSKVDLTLAYTEEEYKRKLKALQERLGLLHSELYRKRIPMVLGFEGWDAGGKGGAIKRLTDAMDPRGYLVSPTAAPTAVEKNHHYLWRFWKNMPKDGHVTIFDRTWYGRVMVERIEGFCTKEEWQRAYREINDMEAHLAHSGAIVLKFWMQIDKEEQERRFKERMENPQKQWKITEEDWRNREKWDLYEEAVNEMIIRTSTSYAPWMIVEGNNKYYARVKVLETVVKAMEERLK